MTNSLGSYDRSRFDMRKLREQRELEADQIHVTVKDEFGLTDDQVSNIWDRLSELPDEVDQFEESPAELRQRAAEDLAEEFGTDVSEWLV